MKIQSNITEKIMMFEQKYKETKKPALAKMGLQLLRNIVNGTQYEPVTPPVRKGILKGSGSVFVGSELIGVSPLVGSAGSPNTSHSEKDDVITVGFNTEYAAKMHEDLEPEGDLTLGERSYREGHAGGKFLEKHLMNTKEIESLMAVFGTQIKNEVIESGL